MPHRPVVTGTCSAGGEHDPYERYDCVDQHGETRGVIVGGTACKKCGKWLYKSGLETGRTIATDAF